VERALHLRAAPDEGVDLAGPRALVEVDREGLDRAPPPSPGGCDVLAGSSFEMPCEM